VFDYRSLQCRRGEECGGITAGTEVPRVQLHGWSRYQAHDRAEIVGTVQAANPRDHSKGQGRQHQDDNGRTGHLHAGLARLFRLLRNAGGVVRSHSLGPFTIAGRSLAPMENTTASPNGTHRTRSLGRVAQHGQAAGVAPGILPGLKRSTWDFPMLTSNRSVSCPWSKRVSVLLGRRIRTRMYGGVGGAEPRGSPLSRSLARSGRSCVALPNDASTPAGSQTELGPRLTWQGVDRRSQSWQSCRP
jgi:hypothetical protein